MRTKERDPFPHAGTLTVPPPSALTSIVMLVVLLGVAWAAAAISAPARPACARPCSVTWQTPAGVPVRVASRLLRVGSVMRVDSITVDGTKLKLPRVVAAKEFTVRGRGVRVTVNARGRGVRWWRLRFTAKTRAPATVRVVYRTLEQAIAGEMIHPSHGGSLTSVVVDSAHVVEFDGEAMP